MMVSTSRREIAITIGTVTANIAAVISRLRPSTSAAAPVKGAVSAIASVPAVIRALISPAPTAELARQLRQQRLRGVKIEEGRKARGCDREPPKVDSHAAR